MGCLSSAITDTGEGLQVSFFRKCQYGCKIEWGDWGFCRTDDDMDWCWQTSNLWFRDHSSSNPNSWNTWFLMLLLRHKIIRAYKITVSLSLDRLQLSDFKFFQTKCIFQKWTRRVLPGLRIFLALRVFHIWFCNNCLIFALVLFDICFWWFSHQ